MGFLWQHRGILPGKLLSKRSSIRLFHEFPKNDDLVQDGRFIHMKYLAIQSSWTFLRQKKSFQLHLVRQFWLWERSKESWCLKVMYLKSSGECFIDVYVCSTAGVYMRGWLLFLHTGLLYSASQENALSAVFGREMKLEKHLTDDVIARPLPVSFMESLEKWKYIYQNFSVSTSVI